MTEHPVQLVVEDDLKRNRLTVFFRLLLALPHIVWLILWSIAVFFAAILNWIVTLIAGRPAGSLHRFLSRYVRYLVHLYAYLWLVANPYPGFVGEEGEYPIDVRLPPPEPQPRWKTLLRILLALPALVLASTLGTAGSIASGSRGGRNRSYSYNASGLGPRSECSAGSRASYVAGCRKASVTPARTASATTRRRSRTHCS